MSFASRALCQERLALVFPEALPQRGRLVGALAAAGVFVCLYVESVGGDNPIRPTMVLWMCDESAARTDPESRRAWYEAARRGKRDLEQLLTRWGIRHRPWYADNTREPLRDETFRAWATYGAIIRDETVQTTSPRPQWSLAVDFAALFDPDLTGDDLAELVDDWRDDHLGAVGRARVALAEQLAGPGEQVVVQFPRGAGTRTLAPGPSSLILKGVVEQLAPRLLDQPAVVFISESRQHLHVIDERLLERLRLHVEESRLLPDALLFDGATGTFWFVEAVFTDGAIDESRKRDLLIWAGAQAIESERCRFVTAFTGRTAAAFRRHVATLAWGTFAWFLDEPTRILRLDDLH